MGSEPAWLFAACGWAETPPHTPQEVKDPSCCQAPTVNTGKADLEPQDQVWAARGGSTLHTLTPGALRVPALKNQALRHPQLGGGGAEGLRELQAVLACPRGHTHRGQEPTHSLRRNPFLQELWEAKTSGMGDQRQWWPAHLPGPCWEPWDRGFCRDPSSFQGPSWG